MLSNIRTNGSLSMCELRCPTNMSPVNCVGVYKNLKGHAAGDWLTYIIT